VKKSTTPSSPSAFALAEDVDVYLEREEITLINPGSSILTLIGELELGECTFGVGVGYEREAETDEGKCEQSYGKLFMGSITGVGGLRAAEKEVGSSGATDVCKKGDVLPVTVISYTIYQHKTNLLSQHFQAGAFLFHSLGLPLSVMCA
jgi:hypothetical protein